MSINLKSSSFDTNYHGSRKAGDRQYGEYIFHNVDAWKTITINDRYKFVAIWQNGVSYLHNEHKYPSTDFEISEDGGAHELIVLVDNMYESDFDGDVSDQVDAANTLCQAIKSAEDLRQLYVFLAEEAPGDPDSFIDEILSKTYFTVVVRSGHTCECYAQSHNARDCGHKHRSESAAEKCMDALTRADGNGCMSAQWYGAKVVEIRRVDEAEMFETEDGRVADLDVCTC